ncbi:MAG: hypothetical protein MUF00_15680 [Gemmatimonadaceae bacterium]|jgi:hypothetical protein|nr:hypothetical protein [Gemmatimonadaceae bacterium]
MLITVFALVAMLGSHPDAPFGQPYRTDVPPTLAPCANLGAAGEEYLSTLRDIVSDTSDYGVEHRAAGELPLVADTNTVQIVTDAATCTRALAAARELLLPEAQASVTAVFVMRVGSTRFVVWNLRRRPGQSRLFDVFDANFRHIVGLTGW